MSGACPAAVTRRSVPSLRRGVRRSFDAARNAHVLLGPERVIVLDDIANAIVELCGTQRAIEDIAKILIERFAGDPVQVESDVVEFFQDLVDKGWVVT
jgi:pyrroloquinoline quinone biosynthesis protein D